MPGEVGNTDVPKKAIQATDVVYTASTLKGVVGNTIPTEQISELTFKFDVTKGIIGEYDVQPDADMELKRLAYTQLSKNLVWSKYQFIITDGSKLYTRDTKVPWADAIRSATEYFSTVKDYQVIGVLSAGAASSHTALGGNWDTSTAEIEDDIVKAIQYVGANSNMQDGEKMSVLCPADVYYEFRKLDLIGNVQQQLRDYLERSFEVDIRSFRPYYDTSGTAQMDALEDDCVVYVDGRVTARHAQFSQAAAVSKGFPTTERWRIPNRGDAYYMRMASAARVTWDGVNSTNTKSNRIYKILDVT